MATAFIEISLKGVRNAVAGLNSISKGIDDLGDGVTKVGRRFEEAGRAFTQLGTTMTVGLSIPIAAASAQLVKLGAQAVETENLFVESVKAQEKSMREFSVSLRKQFGLNDFEIRRQVGTFFTMTEALTGSEKAAGVAAEAMTMLGQDMASFFNLGLEESFIKLQAAIVGEVEPLRRLGRSIDEATVKNMLLTDGLIQQGQALTQQDKVYGRLIAILRQTRTEQGDLARTIMLPMNQFRILRETVELLFTAIGTRLLPVFTPFIQLLTAAAVAARDFAIYHNIIVTDVNESIKPLSDAHQRWADIGIAVGLLGVGAGPALLIMGRLLGTMASLTIVTGGFVQAIGYLGKGVTIIPASVGLLAAKMALLAGAIWAGVRAFEALEATKAISKEQSDVIRKLAAAYEDYAKGFLTNFVKIVAKAPEAIIAVYNFMLEISSSFIGILGKLFIKGFEALSVKLEESITGLKTSILNGLENTVEALQRSDVGKAILKYLGLGDVAEGAATQLATMRHQLEADSKWRISKFEEQSNQLQAGWQRLVMDFTGTLRVDEDPVGRLEKYLFGTEPIADQFGSIGQEARGAWSDFWGSFSGKIEADVDKVGATLTESFTQLGSDAATKTVDILEESGKFVRELVPKLAEEADQLRAKLDVSFDTDVEKQRERYLELEKQLIALYKQAQVKMAEQQKMSSAEINRLNKQSVTQLNRLQDEYIKALTRSKDAGVITQQQFLDEIGYLLGVQTRLVEEYASANRESFEDITAYNQQEYNARLRVEKLMSAQSRTAISLANERIQAIYRENEGIGTQAQVLRANIRLLEQLENVYLALGNEDGAPAALAKVREALRENNAQLDRTQRKLAPGGALTTAFLTFSDSVEDSFNYLKDNVYTPALNSLSNALVDFLSGADTSFDGFIETVKRSLLKLVADNVIVGVGKAIGLDDDGGFVSSILGNTLGSIGGSLAGAIDPLGDFFSWISDFDFGSIFAASGGFIRGPGGPREDRVPAMLSDGEFVVNAAATKQFLPLLAAINGKQFADGGLVGSSGGSDGYGDFARKIGLNLFSKFAQKAFLNIFGVPSMGTGELIGSLLGGGIGTALTGGGIAGLGFGVGTVGSIGAQAAVPATTAAIAGNLIAPIFGMLASFALSQVFGSFFGPGQTVGPNGTFTLKVIDGKAQIANIGTDNGAPEAALRGVGENFAAVINLLGARKGIAMREGFHIGRFTYFPSEGGIMAGETGEPRVFGMRNFGDNFENASEFFVRQAVARGLFGADRSLSGKLYKQLVAGVNLLGAFRGFESPTADLFAAEANLGGDLRGKFLDLKSIGTDLLIQNAIPLATGGHRTVQRPTLFLAGENGPEDVMVSPLANGRAGRGGGTSFVFQGPVILDDIEMKRLARRLRRAESR